MAPIFYLAGAVVWWVQGAVLESFRPARFTSLEKQLRRSHGIEQDAFGAEAEEGGIARASAAKTLLSLPIEEVPDHLLLATLLSGATRGDPVEVSLDLLKNARGDLANLDRADIYQRTKGLGPVARARVLAARELSRRSGSRKLPEKITSPADAWRYLKTLSHGPQERLSALYLDRRGRILGSRTISVGSSGFTIVDPRDILRPALDMHAEALVLAHQHPTGDPTPSHEDIAVTQRVHEASRVLGLQLLDHIVVTPEGFTSLAEMGHVPHSRAGLSLTSR